jgi:uncharacterized protein YjbI with pentapeptide repeats
LAIVHAPTATAFEDFRQSDWRIPPARRRDCGCSQHCGVALHCLPGSDANMGDEEELGPRSAKDAFERRSDVQALYRLGERNFSGQKLDGLSLATMALEGASFIRASLRRANLAHVDLSHADLEGVDLREADCNGSLLVHANLVGVDASEASFDEARLGQACLATLTATGASFISADLQRADASEAHFGAADFRGCDASHASFVRADLRDTSFRDARLVEANLSKADLRGACFDGADLSCADLRGALLAGATFARAELSGARLSPGGAPFSADLGNINNLAQDARRSLTTLLGLCAYVLVSVSTAGDAQLALNRAKVKLPLVGAELPLRLFFVGAAVTTLFSAVYLYLLQGRLVRALKMLPRVFPDGGRMPDRVHPSLLVVALASWFNRGGDPTVPSSAFRATWIRRAFARLSELSFWVEAGAFSLLWGLAPLTIGILLFRFLASKRLGESNLLWVLFATALVLGWLSFLGAYRARQQASPAVVIAGTVCLAATTLICVPGVLTGIHRFRIVAPRQNFSTLLGDQWQGADLERANLSAADVRFARFDKAALLGTRFDGASLSGASLTNAAAEFASFDRADLSMANLAQADLSRAHFTGASLVGANAQQALLGWATLSDARAQGLDLHSAQAEGAHFDGAVLKGAKLLDLRAVAAVFEGANLEGADLSGAWLLKANLRVTQVAGANFAGARLSQADFTGSVDLTPEQLCTAKGWREALLPGDEAKDTRRPFRIDEPGPLRQAAEHLCPLDAQPPG